MIKTIETILVFIAGWAYISLMIDGYTGWSDKGEYKKSFIASLIAIMVFALVISLIYFLF